jgi:hypothetical protein
MAYKEKDCKKCGVKHKKRGEYCSRSCGNSRAMGEQQKESIRQAKKEWIYSDTDTAEEARWRINNHEEPEPVAPIRTQNSLEVNQFVQDGDLWSEV